jgi:hypothetical protein
MTIQTAAAPRLLDIKAAARYLSTTVWQMRSLVWGKKVPHLRLGRRILFDIVDLDALVIEMKKVA